MTYHSCFAMPHEALDVVVIDDSKPMQGILRSVLIALKVKRIRVFDSAEDALHAMLREPPNLILTDWRMGKIGGYQFLRMIRARFMDPLCFVPVIVITAHATRNTLEKAMRAGASLLLVKPIAPAALIDRITWLQNDARQFVLGAKGLFEIEGVAEKLKMQQDRNAAWMKAATAQLQNAYPKDGSDPSKLRNKVKPAVESNAERWDAFLKHKEEEVAHQPARPKSPEETLRNMPKTMHFAALRSA
ncbi:response regulator [Oryzibacter oryziterrae]|uniref:response regulator n=1 Tax=Oryzibacter oryziterrae TaxID=2766474 RepID=UPI001F2781B4|nr:response regulator [Oryzibacter oryziterrae]